MLAEELIVSVESLLTEALVIPTHELEYYDRMQRGKERRAAQPPRPSDGKPVGSPFDYEEYLTRKEDRKAADPEAYQRARASKREANRQWWFNYRERSDFDRCNEVVAIATHQLAECDRVEQYLKR